MNLSNEKNTLLNTVSRLAVSEGARLLGKYVTRGAMMAAALTVGTVVVMDSRPAIASCSDSDFDSNSDDALAGDTGSSGVEVICSDTVAGGYDADGYDQIDVRVIGDGAANPSTGVAIYFGNGTDGDVFDGSITVEDTFIGGAKNVGKVISTNADAIVIEGDNNVINNGLEDEEGPDEVGGGLIQGASDGIDIDGKNNVVHNLNNGYGTGSGVISGGGGGAGDDGIEVSGGTSGAANVIDNGLDSDGNGKMAYIVSGGTPGATNVDGDDGIDADGWTTINNGKMGEIHGEDRGVEFTGPSGSTLTVDNDGKIIGDQEDGIVIQSDDVIVNYSGGGTLSGGREVGGKDGAGIDVGSGADGVKVNVTFDKGGLIEGFSHGIEVGPNGDNNILVLKGAGTIEGDGGNNSDSIHVFETGTGNDITLDGKILVQGKDDGVDLGSGNKLTIEGASTVQGDTDGTNGGDGIQGNDNNTVLITGASKVIGDPGILMDDGNNITVDGGSDVTGDPEDGINVDDDNTILIGGAGGAGTVYGKGANSDGIALTDEFDNDGGGQDDNSVTIGKGGTVDAKQDGIVVGQVDADNQDNSVLIEDGGNVIAGRDGIVVNGQDADADYNTVTINDGGEVNAKGDGVRLLGDSIVTNVFDALVGGGPVIFGEPDGVGNDLVNDGIIRAGDEGVLVSNTNSDVDNSGGEIYAGGDGVRFTTLHTDEADGDGGGVDESGYQSDADSVIVAGRDGIHYDNYSDDASSDDALQVSVTGEDINGLGQVDVKLLNVFPIIKGYFPEVVENDGVIEAQRHGISVNDDFDVTNGEDGVIVAGGLPGEGASGGDGIHADANNRIDNFGTIATGADADGDSHGIEVDGESNTIINAGLIDTRGDTNIDGIDNGTLEKGNDKLQDNGAGGDGIHANSDGLTLGGLVKQGYDQQQIRNYGTIIAADDGIDAQSGLGIPGGEQIIYNGLNGEITANDDGIVAENYNDIWNRGVINADDDGEDGGDGIVVGHSNVVTNDGKINSIGGNGVVMGGQKGPFTFGNLVTNTGDIDAGEDGVLALGDENYIENTGNIKGGEDGVDLEGRDNTFVSTDGVIEGGSGAGINSDDHNTIELSGTTKVTSTDGSGGDGIVLDNFNSLTIEDGVTVHGDNDGIVLDGSHNAVEYEGDEGVSKDPELTGGTGDGIRINGSSNTFITTDDVDVDGGDDGIDIGGNSNIVEISGDVSGEDDGIHLDTATGNVVYVGGNVTGDSDDNEGGDGVDIFGGGSNSITVDGAISGDPGVVITNSSNNSVSGGSISGTNGGVIISTGNNNTVTSNTYIEGGAGDGVGITGKSNIVTAGEDISGADGVDITGNLNEVSGHDINGDYDGVSIDGIGNVVTATGAITGEDSQGVAITGKNNTVTADGAITGSDEGVLIDGNNNEVSSESISSDGSNGVGITGDSNTIDTGAIFGGNDGVNIYGDSNNVDSTGISGDGDAVDIVGDNNTIGVDGNIDGDVEQLGYGNGVLINGSNNSVSANDIGVSGTGTAGVSIVGDNNTIDANNISGEDGAGVYLNGDSNTVDADGQIGSTIDDGVQISGNSNDLTAGNGITGGEDGTEIDGNGNSVVANGTIDGNGEDGVDIDGNNNSVEADGVEGLNDGLLVFGGNNTIEVGKDGITGQNDDGVDMFGLGNEVVVLGAIYGLDNGVVLEASNSSVVAFGGIEGENGDGVNIGGTNNIVVAGEDSNILGGLSGVVIDGDSNTVSSQDITGEDGDGVNIAGNSNNVDASGNVKGTDDGVNIDGGANNVTVTGDITGGIDGVEIQGGSNNTVTASGAILGQVDDGVVINGGSNNTATAGGSITGTSGTGTLLLDTINSTVTSGGNIVGGNSAYNDGVQIVGGGDNNVSAAGAIQGHDGIVIYGSDGNSVTAGGSVIGSGDSAATIIGDDNSVEADDFSGVTLGVYVQGDDNDVTGTSGGVSATGIAVAAVGDANEFDFNGAISGRGGVYLNGNDNSLTGGAVTASKLDGVNIDGTDNDVTVAAIISGDEGVEITGDDNTVATGTISATGNGVVIDAGSGNKVSTGTITAGVNGARIGSGNTLAVTGSVTGNGGNGIIGVDNNIVTVTGGVTGNAGDGIKLGAGNSVTTDGTVQGSDDAIEIDGGANNVTITGQLKGTGGDGIDIAGDGNQVKATAKISSQLNGVVIVGGNNTVGVGNTAGLSITAQTLDGVSITGSGNSVTTSALIRGGDDGVEIDGDNNTVKSGGNIVGDGAGGNNGDGDGVDINGNGNTVTSGISIFGDPGVIITGNQNAVSAVEDINGVLGGAIISGNQNVVTAGGDITTTSGFGAGITGNQNVVTAGDDIKSTNNDGVNIAGNQNQVTANDIYGGIDGIQINGNQNFVDAAATVTGVTGNGVHFDSGTGNNVDLTDVTVTAGKDGILVDVDGNEFQHNCKTVINAGDDGIEYGFGGLVNAYESLVWAGTINAADDGIVADKGFFTIINNGTINADKDKNSDGNGITLASDNTVENNGTITGWNGIVGDDRNIITNDGTITVTNDGIVVDDENKVINNGTITAGDDGIVADDKNYIENNSNLTINAKDNGIEVDDSNKVVNTGTINADTDKNNDGTGIVADDFNDINTSGTITGYNGIEIDYTNVVLNTGSITATNFGVLATDDANKITNDSYISAGTSGVRVVYGHSNLITNNDYIHGGDTGVQIDNGDSNTLTNNSGAEIDANNEGVNIENDSDYNTVNNYGMIDAYNVGVNIENYSDYNTVNNYGTIEAYSEGIEVETGSDDNVINNWGDIYGWEGVEFENNAEGNTLNNWGLIDGVDAGVDIENANYNNVNNYGIISGEGYAGIYIEDSYVTDIYSNGTIIGAVYGVEGVYSSDAYITGDSGSVIVGGTDGINMYESDYFRLFNSGSVTGVEGDGVDLTYSDHADVSNYVGGSIFGGEDGVYVWNGEDTDIYNSGTITGALYDGIGFDNSDDSYVYNRGTITGEDDGIANWASYGQAGTLGVANNGGSITGQNEDGIYTEGDTWVSNYNGGTITGGYGGIHADENASLSVWNGEGSEIIGQNGDGIYTWSDDEGDAYVEIYNAGLIQGAIHGIHNDGNSNVYVENYGIGTITGTDAGYLYEDNGYSGDAYVHINNYGLIEVTGPGVLPTALVDDPATKDVDESKGALDYVNGKGADPVAAIDVRDGGPGLETYVFNWGEINGANDFSAPVPAVVDDPATKDVNEAKAAIPAQQLTNRFAILGGEGSEYIANFNGGTINGDIATQAGDDVLALEIGSTLNGNVNMGQTLQTDDVLALIKDDPATKDVDESKGGTAVGFVSTKNVDVGLDTVVLFGEGYQDLASNITEAEVLYVNDQITEYDIYYGEDFASLSVQPVLENQPSPQGTWSLNGNVKVDGTNLWTFVDIDTNGDGKTDEEGLPYISGTFGTVVDNGRLNVGGTIFVVTDEEKGTGNYVVQKTAMLTSPVVDVWSGGTLGGHGTIVTNPGANGGNGGVNLTGAVQGDKTVYLGATESTIHTQYLDSEARGAFIIGTTTVDLVTQKADGTITDKTKGDGTNDFTITKVDGKDVKADVKVTVDSIGNLYPDIKLPAGWVSETFSGPFDFTTDSPRYATLAPGDEITRIGTLTVVGNVTMDDRETATTTYTVKVADDPATKDVDESKGGTATKTQTGRTVVTNWGSQFQADLKADGTGDRLNVVKSGTTKAFTGGTFDTTGLGTVDLVTQDAKGVVTDAKKGDGVPDYTIVSKDGKDTKVDTLVAGKGKADGVPDGIAYKVSTVLDGHATVDGRLDIRLDGQFVDLVDNSQPATLPNPATGCDNAPDGTPNCAPLPNPAYKIPDGIADVDAKGIATNNADFSKDAKVWDIIVAAGGVSGKFDEKGFDGGPNDGAVVVRYDDPETAADEEVRVQLLKAYLQYLPDRVRIISIPKFGPKGSTINQIATGNYLDTLTKYGLNEDALHAAIALVGTASNIPAALDALHPEWYNAFNEVGFSIARGAEQQAYIRTIEAQGFSGGQQNRVVMNVGDDSAVGSSASDRRATFWLAGSWGNANIDDGSDEGWLEYKYETLTGYAGFDYMINPNFLVGIMGGFSNSNVDAKNASGNKGDVDSWQVSGYVSYFTDSWFLNAGGGIGDMNIESIRNIQFGSGIGNISEVANADYDGDITFFYGKGGYSFDLGASGWKLSPELALSYAEVKQNGFSETGTGNAPVFLLNVDGQSEKSLRGTAQLRLSKTFLSGNGGGWMPYVRVGLANEFEDNLRPITSGFQGAPGTSFTVFGQVPRQTTVIFGAGITGKVTEMFSLYLDYSGEIGGSFSEHVISGGVRLHF